MSTLRHYEIGDLVLEMTAGTLSVHESIAVHDYGIQRDIAVKIMGSDGILQFRFMGADDILQGVPYNQDRQSGSLSTPRHLTQGL